MNLLYIKPIRISLVIIFSVLFSRHSTRTFLWPLAPYLPIFSWSTPSFLALASLDSVFWVPFSITPQTSQTRWVKLKFASVILPKHVLLPLLWTYKAQKFRHSSAFVFFSNQINLFLLVGQGWWCWFLRFLGFTNAILWTILFIQAIIHSNWKCVK